MENTRLKMETRKDIGGGKARRLRRNGYIPAVVYGRGMESAAAQVKIPEMMEFISKHGRNSIFTTEFAEEHNFSALIKDIQYNSLNNDIIHVDFQKVSLTDKVHAGVPVKVTGKEGIKGAGSVIVHQLNEVTVECLPRDIPQYVYADVSGMTAGHSLTAAQLRLPQEVTLITEPGDVILSITNGKLDAPAAPANEPLLIRKGEEENDGTKRV